MPPVIAHLFGDLSGVSTARALEWPYPSALGLAVWPTLGCRLSFTGPPLVSPEEDEVVI